jgi:antitoxin component YwqK of YwqJK toxin-antitoxin module
MSIKHVGSFILMAVCLFGTELKIESPQKITPEWKQKVFGIKYDISTLDNAVGEMVEGLIDGKFNKAFIARIKTEIEKHPAGEGVYIERWNSGRIKARLPYKDGKAHGHLHGWYLSRNDAFKGYFKEGVKQGIHITFFEKSKKGISEGLMKDIRTIDDARMLRFNEKGQLEGQSTKDHPSGKLWISMYYKNGKAHGALEEWDDKGRYLFGAQYKKGFLQKKPPPPPGKRGYSYYSIEEKYVNEVTREFKKLVKREFGLSSCGSGASMPFDVEKICVHFAVPKRGTVEEARELMVKLKERFLGVINAHEKIRPYLREYPCTINRADINLRFCDEKGREYTDKSVGYVIVGSDNNIHYCYSDQKKDSWEDLYKEPYEKAAEIVHAKKE